MLRLLLLSASAAVIFAGLSVPFAIPGFVGYLLALVLLLIGSTALWLVERKTAGRLNRDGSLNDILNINDGQD
jgi:hypothetical protein